MQARSRIRWAIAVGVGIGIAVAMPPHARGACPAPGFAVERVITDRVLHQTWAVVEDCSHPERPLKMVPLAKSTSLQHGLPRPANRQVQVAAADALQPLVTRSAVPKAFSIAVRAASSSALPTVEISPAAMPFSSPTSSPTLVRAGDRVHVWSASANVRLEIDAIALEYGRTGQVIHLRRLGRNQTQTTLLAGLVDGEDSAELLP